MSGSTANHIYHAATHVSPSQSNSLQDDRLATSASYAGVPLALAIAGSDSGGGAGIQADLKTFQELSVYGMSVITAVTAQNTLGIKGIHEVGTDAVLQQLDAIGEDLTPHAVKTGMLASGDIVHAVADKLAQYGWRNLVIDPVMLAKGGSTLLRKEALHALTHRLIPLSRVITPNVPEAEELAGMTITRLSHREEAAKRIRQMGAACVILKGGHDPATKDKVVDMVYDGANFHYMEGRRIDTPHTHGTGCTYSAAVAAELARGRDVLAAAKVARAFIQAAIEDGLRIGGGQGPTNHFAYRRRQS
ncbi:bifunctional hydroxymethylpyrimidine kinase/phosphomethylpyrimidine kinase [Paenibacillus sp. J5C_2022]|uniref:bifunctional hydroxymethylpyrimidine kinase/phosphomethylpyrimidine kinase n=1 Tax=Paenibacillus sp. J5C2022 TaxID=2977129 RepID=UPI0021D0FB75|nr:bifunctional hydroxymethylpyrimidine kinase/phosphomethylpyrimidine kinase [Paenibacillus sp. J5C2022]MCU6711771.1 bifunctional hydroxymethylpyrimidine kinase/phosphomethylpyrimidine kinase [Paenibacillus sp. J5C2022]